MRSIFCNYDFFRRFRRTLGIDFRSFHFNFRKFGFTFVMSPDIRLAFIVCNGRFRSRLAVDIRSNWEWLVFLAFYIMFRFCIRFFVYFRCRSLTIVNNRRCRNIMFR